MKMIMKQQSSRYTAPSWLKWVLLIVGLLILLSGCLLTWMYVQIQSNHTEGYSEAKSLALSKTNIASVSDVTSYNGERPIHIVRGKTESDEELAAFINLNNAKVLTTINTSTMVSSDQLKKELQANCSSCSFLDIQLAYEENSPAWELTYIDENQRYVLEYVKAENGKPIQRFAFRQPQT